MLQGGNLDWTIVPGHGILEAGIIVVTRGKKGVFSYAKTHPTMVRYRSAFTDGDARLREARKTCDAAPVLSKSRNLSTETDLPTVSTVHLSRRGQEINTCG